LSKRADYYTGILLIILFFYIFVCLFRLNTISGIVIAHDYLLRIEPPFNFRQEGKGKPLLPPWGKAGKGVKKNCRKGLLRKYNGKRSG
jgi:hypothetical protein